MSSEDEGLDEFVTNAIEDFKAKHMDGLHFTDLVDMQNYFLGQEFYTQDLKYKMNIRRSRLNKKIKTGSVYGMDE